MAFNGRAVYSDWDSHAEDLSDIVAMLAVKDTPLLDILGTSERPATSVKHEWIEDTLRPHTSTMSSNVASTATGTGIEPAKTTTMFRVGDLVRLGSGVYNEVCLVTSVDATTLYVTRAQGGTTATSFAAGAVIEVIGNAALSGADVDEDWSQDRARCSNYAQIFEIGIKISGTEQAVGGFAVGGDEFAYQKANRLGEEMRELEKSILMGRSLTNTIGTATARRFMAGIAASISTNVFSHATFTESAMNSTLQLAYDQGSSNINLLVVRPLVKRLMSTWNANRLQIIQTDSPTARENWFKSLVSVYEGDFGVQQVLMNRYLTNEGISLLGLDTTRVKVVPVIGRSFQYDDLAKAGDSEKGMIVGEYTVEFRNPLAHAKFMGA